MFEFVSGRRRLAQIVAEDCKPDDQIVLSLAGAFLGEPVQAVQGMNPDVAFRMPERILLAALENGEFWMKPEPAAVAQELKAQRGLHALDQQLLPFLPDALARLPLLGQGS